MKSTILISLHIGIVLFTSTPAHCQNKYFKAIDLDKMELFEQELAKGSDINFQRKDDGYTPLMILSPREKSSSPKESCGKMQS
jgi:hypothetical protein